MEFDARGMPKWSQSRCEHSSKFNAKIGNEKEHKNNLLSTSQLIGTAHALRQGVGSRRVALTERQRRQRHVADQVCEEKL